ncbi:hypothetical protein EVA_16676, partial [gut metagenome]
TEGARKAPTRSTTYRDRTGSASVAKVGDSDKRYGSYELKDKNGKILCQR